MTTLTPEALPQGADDVSTSPRTPSALATQIGRRVGGVFLPWSTVKEAEALAPSRVWSPERHGPVIPCGLVAFVKSH